MNCLVTGATGFIGGFLTKKLLHSGHEVRILRRKNSDLSELQDLPLKQAIGDITNLESLCLAVEGVHCVFHLAGKIAYSKRERASMEAINVQGTKNVLQACREKGIQKLVHISSVVAVGSGFNQEALLNEKSPYNMKKFDLGYFETKKAAEDLVIKECRDRDFDAVIVNPSVVYGPGDVRKSSRKLPLKIAKGEFPFYSMGGISVAYVEDVVEGICQAWKKGRKGERYILGGENLKLKEVFDLIATETGVHPPRFCLPSSWLFFLGAFGDFIEKTGRHFFVNSELAKVVTLFHWFDSSKAKRELGFQSRSAKHAISMSVKWMKEQNLL